MTCRLEKKSSTRLSSMSFKYNWTFILFFLTHLCASFFVPKMLALDKMKTFLVVALVNFFKPSIIHSMLQM